MINRTQEEIMRNWPMDYNAPLVSIRCLAFNHEKFIMQAIDGFLMQKTNFPFEIVIHDDASTDKTASIIQYYETRFPKIIKAIYEKENLYSRKDGSLGRIVTQACLGKYIAYCEGDDYWVDADKLQKQVDVLESDEDCSLVHTGFFTVDENSVEISRKRFDEYQKESLKEIGLVSLFKRNHIMTVSVMIRREVLFSSIYSNCGIFWDYTLFFSAAFYGKIRFIPSKMVAYRKVGTSVTQSNGLILYKSSYKVYQYFAYLLLIKKIKKISFTDHFEILHFVEVNMIIHKDFKGIFRVLKYNKFGVFLMPFAITRAICLKILPMFV